MSIIQKKKNEYGGKTILNKLCFYLINKALLTRRALVGIPWYITSHAKTLILKLTRIDHTPRNL